MRKELSTHCEKLFSYFSQVLLYNRKYSQDIRSWPGRRWFWIQISIILLYPYPHRMVEEPAGKTTFPKFSTRQHCLQPITSVHCQYLPQGGSKDVQIIFKDTMHVHYNTSVINISALQNVIKDVGM